MSEIHGAVGAYVVNALEGAELSEFETHLATCETCRREVVEFSETAGHLGSLVETAPPPALRNSILSAIREVRPLPPELPADSPEAPTAPQRLSLARDDIGTSRQLDAGEQWWDDPTTPTEVAVGDEAGSRSAAVTGDGAVDELAIRRTRRSARVWALVAAAAFVVALGLGGWVVNLHQDRAPVAASTLEAQLLAAPDLRVVTIAMKNGGEASFRVSKSLDKALFVGRSLPAPGAGKDYQLWTIKGATAVPDRTFGGGATAQTWFGGDVTEADGAAITIEPSGGSTKPTLPILATVEL